MLLTVVKESSRLTVGRETSTQQRETQANRTMDYGWATDGFPLSSQILSIHKTDLFHICFLEYEIPRFGLQSNQLQVLPLTTLEYIRQKYTNSSKLENLISTIPIL